MQQFFETLEKSSWAVGIRQSLYLYPVLEIIHILGIVLLVGSAFLFDLRLLGYSKTLPVRGLAKHVLPWSQRGLILVVPSGLLLFITNAQTLAADPTFWLKIGLIGVAALNVWIFHKFIYSFPPGAEDSGELPSSSKVSALISILVWIAVIACGRLLAY